MLLFVGTLLAGLMVGLIAQTLALSDRGVDWALVMVLSVAGAFLGSHIGHILGFYAAPSSTGWIASVVGASIAAYGYYAIRDSVRS